MRTTTTRSVVVVLLVALAAGAAAVPAQAALTDTDREIADTTIAPGETTTVTVTATVDSSGGSFSLTENFAGEVAEANIQDVTVDGATVDPFFSQADNTTAVATLSETGAGAQVEVTYEVTATANSGEIEINGSATSGDTVDLGVETISVEENPLRASLSAADSELEPGQTTTLTTTVENPRSKISLNHSFEGVVADASVSNITVNGVDAETITDPITVAEPNGTVVALDNLTVNDTVAVEVAVTASENASAGDTIAASGQVTSANSTVTLESQSVTIIEPDPVKQYAGDDGSVDIRDIGDASLDYARGDLTLREFSQIATAYALG